jgi:uracil-DNA glycosylase
VLTGWTPAAEQAVVAAVKAVSADREIAPPDPFRALRLLAPADVKVVVFGQDPYPRPGHATGLAFSAGHGKPVSLRRIFEILKADRPGWQPPERWLLDGWARQGVLMLNTVLTVEVGLGGRAHELWLAIAHFRYCPRAGEPREAPPTFLLWGKPAQAFFDAAVPPARRARAARASPVARAPVLSGKPAGQQQYRYRCRQRFEQASRPVSKPVSMPMWLSGRALPW